MPTHDAAEYDILSMYILEVKVLYILLITVTYLDMKVIRIQKWALRLQ